MEDFDREIYGRLPKKIPSLKWILISTNEEKNGDIPILVKKLEGRVDNSSYPKIVVNIQLTVTTPALALGPVPLIMELSWNFRPSTHTNSTAPPEPT